MAAPGEIFTVFDSRFGPCGIAWSADAITRIQLTDATAAEINERWHGLGARRLRGAPPPFVREAIARVRRHLGGKPQDFSALPLAFAGLPPARQKIYQAARRIPAGQTLTYAALAAAAGIRNGARAAGAAMAENPFILAVPCHRVLGANGALHGFSARGGIFTKQRLLQFEGIRTSIPRASVPRRRRDGLEFDWAAALAHLRKVDPPLARLIARVGRRQIEIRTMHDPFESLVRSIVYQQLSGKAAGTILGRMLEIFGKRFPSPAELIATPDDKLRAAGLSTNKTKALKDLAAKAEAGVIPKLRALDRLRDEEIVDRLTSVYGIGTWSVEMMLMFRLGRADVLPVDDLGVRKGFALTYGGKPPSPAALADYAERWRPYRSVASWYMWRAIELAEADKAASGK
jgi:O-6-methylguanine DNA methyltransferase